jgi:hypothetical protein
MSRIQALVQGLSRNHTLCSTMLSARCAKAPVTTEQDEIALNVDFTFRRLRSTFAHALHLDPTQLQGLVSFLCVFHARTNGLLGRVLRVQLPIRQRV